MWSSARQVRPRPQLAIAVVLVVGCGGADGSVGADGDALDAWVADDAAAPDDAGAPDDARGARDATIVDDAAVVDDASGASDASMPPVGVEDPTHSSEAALADPDTVLARSGDYITYGTTVGAGRGPRCGAPSGKLYVPYLVHGAGNRVGMSDCYAGDAMPDGPGAWAERGGSIWAPGVARFGDRYFMFYVASRRGAGQKCIGRASSTGARGPFVDLGEWACPGDGRWVIDPDPVVVGDDRMFVTYRDDEITRFPETGISVVRTDDVGRAVWSSRVDLLLSTDIDWDTIRISGTTHVVENPSLFRSDGTWYLAYSGNNWDSARYATGIADCGSTILPSSRCAPIHMGVRRPHFGFTGAAGLDPYRGLPENHRGPGGMDVFHALDGTLRVVWHWWRPSDGTRHVVVGRLLTDDGGFYVGP